jgi:hypothetical protein
MKRVFNIELCLDDAEALKDLAALGALDVLEFGNDVQLPSLKSIILTRHIKLLKEKPKVAPRLGRILKLLAEEVNAAQSDGDT